MRRALALAAALLALAPAGLAATTEDEPAKDTTPCVDPKLVLLVPPATTGLLLRVDLDETTWSLQRLGSDEPTLLHAAIATTLILQTVPDEDIPLTPPSSRTVTIDADRPCLRIVAVKGSQSRENTTAENITHFNVTYRPTSVFVGTPDCSQEVVATGTNATLCTDAGAAVNASPEGALLDFVLGATQHRFIDVAPPRRAVVDTSALNITDRDREDTRANVPLADLTNLSLALQGLASSRTAFVNATNATTLAAFVAASKAATPLVRAALLDGEALANESLAATDRTLRERLRDAMRVEYASSADCALDVFATNTTTIYLCVTFAESKRPGVPLPEEALNASVMGPANLSLLGDARWQGVPADLAVSPLRAWFRLSPDANDTIVLASSTRLANVTQLASAVAKAREAHAQLEKAVRGGDEATLAALDEVVAADAQLRALLVAVSDPTSGTVWGAYMDEHDAHAASVAAEALRPTVVQQRIVLWSTLVLGLGIALAGGIVTGVRLDARYQNLAAFRQMGSNPARGVAIGCLAGGVALLITGVVLAIVLDLPLLRFLVTTP